MRKILILLLIVIALPASAQFDLKGGIVYADKELTISQLQVNSIRITLLLVVMYLFQLKSLRKFLVLVELD